MFKQAAIILALAAATNAIPQYGAPEQPTPAPGSDSNSIDLVSDLRVFCLEMCIDLAPNEAVFNRCQDSCVAERTEAANAEADAGDEFPAAIVGGCIAAGVAVIGIVGFLCVHKNKKAKSTPTRKNSKEADLLNDADANAAVAADKSAEKAGEQPGSATSAGEEATPATAPAASASDAVVIVIDEKAEEKAAEKVAEKAATAKKKVVVMGSLTQQEGYELHAAAMQKEGAGEDAIPEEEESKADSDDAASNGGDDAANSADDAASNDGDDAATSADDSADAKSDDGVIALESQAV